MLSDLLNTYPLLKVLTLLSTLEYLSAVRYTYLNEEQIQFEGVCQVTIVHRGV